jgi:hypothetical protein
MNQGINIKPSNNITEEEQNSEQNSEQPILPAVFAAVHAYVNHECWNTICLDNEEYILWTQRNEWCASHNLIISFLILISHQKTDTKSASKTDWQDRS